MTRVDLFGIPYSVTDYEQASEVILANALVGQSYGVSALAVHGLIEGRRCEPLRQQMARIDLILPDGQPIRWAMNYFYKTQLKERVYGPTLTLHVLEKAEAHRLKIFLYGSTQATLEKFALFIQTRFPAIEIVGVHVDRFRDATPEEDALDVKRIRSSGAQLVLVGRGCPRQERWVADHLGKIPAVMMAVGAAFDFHAGTLRQAPAWVQRHGLEWLFRLLMEPRRLWKRYLVTNTWFLFLCIRAVFSKRLS